MGDYGGLRVGIRNLLKLYDEEDGLSRRTGFPRGVGEKKPAKETVCLAEEEGRDCPQSIKGREERGRKNEVDRSQREEAVFFGRVCGSEDQTVCHRSVREEKS